MTTEVNVPDHAAGASATRIRASAMNLEGRVALVTGGGQGAGRASARGLAAHGARVIVADTFDDSGVETAELIENDGGCARFVRVDVTDEHSTRAAVESAAAIFGGIDTLVNNPNRYRDTRFTALADLTAVQWDATMATMVRGTFFMCKAAVPHLAKSTNPTIVNHTSTAAYGVRNWLDFAAARGAVIAMTRSLAKELAPAGIRVNALCIGSMASEAIALGLLDSEEQMTSTPDFAMQLIQRVSTEDDFAGPIAFLASEASAYMTGQTLCCDGGKNFLG